MTKSTLAFFFAFFALLAGCGSANSDYKACFDKAYAEAKGADGFIDIALKGCMDMKGWKLKTQDANPRVIDNWIKK